MKTTIQKLPKSQIEIRIEVSPEEFNNFYQKAILDLGKDLEMPGFRKGKVPREIIEKAVSQEKILETATELAAKESYLKAIFENKIDALGQPQIEILKVAVGNPLEFKAKVSIMPEIKLPDYKEVASKVKRNKIEVSDKEIEEALKWLQKSRAKFTLKNEPARKGDWVEIEYSTNLPKPGPGKPDKEGVGNFKDAFVLGEGHLTSGFEENLIGMKAEEEKEFSLPSASNPDLARAAGSDLVEVKVKMKSVQNMELPELNDEFTKSLGKFENLNALRQSVQVSLRMEKEKQELRRVRQEILEKIAGKSEIEIPEILIEEQKKRYSENLKNEVAKALQISFEDYLKKINKTEEALLNSFQESAQKQVRNSLVLREIQKKENIEVSDRELNEEINKILKSFPSPEEAEKKFDPEQLKSYTKEVIKQEKVFQILEKLTPNP